MTLQTVIVAMECVLCASVPVAVALGLHALNLSERLPDSKETP